MTPERWKEIKRKFDEALTLGRAERESFLKLLRAADPEMCSEVESLLLAHEARPGFLETPPVDTAAMQIPHSPDWVGRVLEAAILGGNYNLSNLGDYSAALEVREKELAVAERISALEPGSAPAAESVARSLTHMGDQLSMPR